MEKGIHDLCNKSIQDNELIWFQYRVIHKILGTNSLLYKMKKFNSHLCRLCQETEEIETHLFYQCKIAANLIINLCSWIYISTGIQCQPTLQEVIFGKIDQAQFVSLCVNEDILLKS